MSLTIALLHMLKSPFSTVILEEQPMFDTLQCQDLLECAKKNRIVLMFLESLRETTDKLDQSLVNKEYERYHGMISSVSRISHNLSSHAINHAVYKTVRPYRSATVDIDIVLFEEVTAFKKACQEMEKEGYDLVVQGPRSTTLMDVEAQIGIDLYQEIAVSNVIYLDKNSLMNHTMMLRLPNGSQIRNLTPEADLLCIIAHSIIKEQMYVLSEYYTFLNYLKRMNIPSFLTLVKRNNLTLPTRTHANITALLHKRAHGTVPPQLEEIIRGLGIEDFETSRIIKDDYVMPHKYHPITIGRALLEVAKAPKTRRSMAQQITKMADPEFSKTFLKALIQHTTRQTY